MKDYTQDFNKLDQLNPWQRAAYHEAGHAAMCLLLGVRIISGKINPKGNGVEGELNHDPNTTPAQAAQITVAGVVAEKIYASVRCPAVALLAGMNRLGHDYQTLCQVTARPGFQRRYCAQVERTLRDNWSLVDMIARQFIRLSDQTLTGEQIGEAGR